MCKDNPTPEQQKAAKDFYSITVKFLNAIVENVFSDPPALTHQQKHQCLASAATNVSFKITTLAMLGAITEDQAKFLAEALNNYYNGIISEKGK
jgi:hypothetical protein